MRFVGDLHIHSHFSLATSKQLTPEFLDYWARIKGISLIGTGDFTHQGWLQELAEKTQPAEPGLFRLKPELIQEIQLPEAPTLSREVRFILSAELSSIYKKNGKVRKVHNVILAPSFEIADKIRQSLLRLGINLGSDGRPIMGLDSRTLLEICLEASEDIYFIPAHIWTPWFSVLGSKSGFDTVEECFDDLTPYITSVETGLSTDAPMHWACSFLDRFTLVSNSDAHSPEKLGRNANIFDTTLEYAAITDALKTGDQKKFLGTIDLFPQEGKYHYDGHRKCGIRWSPLDSIRHSEICTKCGRPITVGVMNRVAQLADRDNILERPNRLPFVSIIPLKEILAEINNVGPNSKRIDSEYFKLVRKFGPELFLLLDTPIADIINSGYPVLAEAISRMRQRRVLIQEGFDGEYGVIKVFQPDEIGRSKAQDGLFAPAKQEHEVSPRELINFDLKEFRRQYQKKLAAQPAQLALAEKTPKSEPKTLIKGLNPEQLAAAQHYKGPALITAGPGTGKTRTLIHRIAFLIQHHKVPPEKILAITFTNKAAAEIKTRLQKLLKPLSLSTFPHVSTFHALGYSILQKHFSPTEPNSSISIIDEEDKRFILLHELSIPRKKVKSMASAITRNKQQLLGKEQISDPEEARIFQAYQDYLHRSDLFDLDDCIYQAVLLFKRNQAALNNYSLQFPWILIDEYQDINFAQYTLIRQLMPQPDADLCVIGDPDQAIYAFRGADVRFIREFIRDFPTASIFHLTQSYRCSQTILTASGQILQKKAQASSLIQGLQPGVKINISAQPTDKSEAEFVARSIENIVGGLRFFSMDSDITTGHEHSGISSLSDFAVLCRLKSQMPSLEKAFNDHSIPFRAIKDTAFFRQNPINHIIDLYKLIQNPQDSFIQNKLSTKKIITPDAAASHAQALKDRNVPDTLAEITSRFFPNIQDQYQTLLLQLSETAHDFKNDPTGFLRFVSLGSGMDTYRPELETVTLMTLHAAKGLEFKCVFIVGCEDGILPYSMHKNRDTDPEEERRLLYVGMTRAEKLLILSYAQKRRLQGQEYRLSRSPFLDIIEKELYELAEKPTMSYNKENQMKLF